MPFPGDFALSRSTIARWPTVLLLASIAIIAAAMFEANRALRSQDEIVASTSREYANIAVWGYAQRLTAEMENAVREPLGPVNHGAGLHEGVQYPDVRELPHMLRWSNGCQCHQTRFGPSPMIFWGFTLNSDTLATAVNTYSDPQNGWLSDDSPRMGMHEDLHPGRGFDYTSSDRVWVNRTVTDRIHRGPRTEWYFYTILADRGDSTRMLAFTVMPTIAGDTVVYGVEYSRAQLSAALASTIAENTLLPVALTHGRSNADLLDIAVTDRKGRALYRTGDAAVPYDASDTLSDTHDGLVISARVRPAIAGTLIVGGLPRSHLPFLLGLLGLAGALALVAIGQLRRAGELARLRTDFVANVSHELRTPLAQIRLYVETLMLGRTRSDAERRKALVHIDRETRRLSALVENVLRFGRGASAPVDAAREPLDVAAEAREVVAEFEPLAAVRDARLVVHAEGVHVASMRPGSFRQVALNLLDNAVKYGPAGQTITVAVATVGTMIRLTVSDEGPGVPPPERETIWRPFLRGANATKSGLGGSGIGLTVVRDIATEHGGQARVETTPGGGAMFIVEIPALSRAAQPSVHQADETRTERAVT